MNLREINRLVATKVLRLEEGECPITDRPVWLLNGDYFADQEDFRPSEDIFYAWKAVEKFEIVEIKRIMDGYSCEITLFDPFRIRRGEAETAPLAICLAALKAVGIEVETE